MPLPEHIEWLLENRGQELAGPLQAQRALIEPAQALEVLVHADPSPGLHAVQWMFDILLGGGMRWEDVASGAHSRACETLGWFAQVRAGLPRGQRNLEDYKSLGSLYQAIAPLLAPLLAQQGPQTATDEPKGRALRRQGRQQAYDESIIMCNRPDLIVAVPTTQRASQWWGRGTRWCTAADKDNMFDAYNKVAPLVVIVLPAVACTDGLSGGCKLQLYLDPDGTVQFMDASDAEVKNRFVDQHWTTLAPIMNWALQTHQFMVNSIPPSRWQESMAELVVSRRGLMLMDVEPEFRTPSVCQAAVGEWGMALQWVPPAMMDPVICMRAVEDNGMALQFVPTGLVSESLCLAAVKSVGSALEHVPDHLRSRAILTAALRGDGGALKYIAPRHRDLELCRLAVASGGDAMLHVPKILRDYDLCLAAVTANGGALEHVERRFWTPQLLRAAVVQTGGVLSYVPPELLDHDLCALAIAQDVSAFACVPQHMRTRELSMLAVQSSGRMVAQVPWYVLDDDICMAAVLNHSRAVTLIPDHLVSRDMWLAAVSCSAILVKSVPAEFRDQEMCRAAVARSPWAMRYIPTQFLIPDLVLAAVQADPYSIGCMDEEARTHEACMAAVVRYPELIIHVPQHLVDGVQVALGMLPPQPKSVQVQEWTPERELAGLALVLAGPGPVAPDQPGLAEPERMAGPG